MVTFESLGIRANISSILKRMKITEPTKVQVRAIPLMLKGNDLLVQAKPGTGKTLAYTLPCIQQITSKMNLVMIVIVPTKELAYQVKDDILQLSEPLGLKIAVFSGGKPMQSDSNILDRKNQIIIGTPGRIKDYVNAKLIRFSDLKYAVLDETDKMLELGFLKDIDYLLSRLPKLTQKVMFSATQSKELVELIIQHVGGYEEVVVDDKLISPSLKQYYKKLPNTQKKELLLSLVQKYMGKPIVVFCNKKSVVDYLTEYLKKRGFGAKAMHGDFTSIDRKNIYYLFKNKKIKILVATDVASRGLHNEDLEVIINYDLPRIESDYVHRVGRTARLGNSGISISFVCPEDESRLRRIEEYTTDTMQEYIL